jgi:prepilin-type N-terminal cleavage/methylation domain-containing protein
MSRRRAFTLIELMVVVTIITMLIALLIPGLRIAGQTARAVSCASNQRQLSAAMIGYVADSLGVTMPFDGVTHYWHLQLGVYLGAPNYEQHPDNRTDHSLMKVLLCPSTKFQDPAFNFGNADTAWNWMYGGSGSYGMNLWLINIYPDYYPGIFASDKDKFYPRYVGATPAMTPLFTDSNWVGSWPEDQDYVGDLYTGWGRHEKRFFMGRVCVDRHSMAVNSSFVDGSVRRIPLGELWSLKWHQTFSPWVQKVP